jgi:ABC-type hemin transport system substrate-binding protein
VTGGRPESEDLRRRLRENARARLKPGTGVPKLLAEGGFVFQRLTLVVACAAAVSLLSISPAGAATVPHRIVSLSPTATESLFAIGAGKQVGAGADQ